MKTKLVHKMGNLAALSDKNLAVKRFTTNDLKFTVPKYQSGCVRSKNSLIILARDITKNIMLQKIYFFSSLHTESNLSSYFSEYKNVAQFCPSEIMKKDPFCILSFPMLNVGSNSQK